MANANAPSRPFASRLTPLATAPVSVAWPPRQASSGESGGLAGGMDCSYLLLVLISVAKSPDVRHRE